jgi:hypothetical protein
VLCDERSAQGDLVAVPGHRLARLEVHL